MINVVYKTSLALPSLCVDKNHNDIDIYALKIMRLPLGKSRAAVFREIRATFGSWQASEAQCTTKTRRVCLESLDLFGPQQTATLYFPFVCLGHRNGKKPTLSLPVTVLISQNNNPAWSELQSLSPPTKSAHITVFSDCIQPLSCNTHTHTLCLFANFPG